ncbi:uncharacterized protein LOC114434549 [Parambassis ranga]|uniref:Uncharacterized protein LOC114434549 n=1 Tax=Parambassis ranga TaxID=210632 RepID=A0A6P7I1H2_9TELE|nr:uncharacterized protein LOC114434549 [Parambassis ranga]XP_028259668.1 uncharacterized protein LOC114434549 [Parambassis ranga]
MKMIACLPLLWLLSGSAEALQCLSVMDNYTSVQNCAANQLCATVAYSARSPSMNKSSGLFRTCSPPYFCNTGHQPWSYSYLSWSMAASVQCCNTDYCNSQDLPYPNIDTKNGLQCFTCPPDGACESEQCVGGQDRCFIAYFNVLGRDYNVSGCVSSNACEALSQEKVQSALAVYMNFTSAPRCCESSFCNSAWTFKVSVLALLPGLIDLVL